MPDFPAAKGEEAQIHLHSMQGQRPHISSEMLSVLFSGKYAQSKGNATMLIQYADSLQKNLNCSLFKALQILEKTPEEYEQAIQLLNSL